MFLRLLLLLAIFSPQLDPALMPHKAPKPTLPFIQKNACPFEGCQFGKWTAIRSVKLYSTWKDNVPKKVVAILAPKEAVTAVTGIHITYEPGEIKVTAPDPLYKLKPGDIVYSYMDLGEGVFNAWFNGFWVEQFDGSGIVGPHNSGCRRNCTGVLLKQARTAWWVEIRTGDNKVGWTREAEDFRGKDALAAPDN